MGNSGLKDSFLLKNQGNGIMLLHLRGKGNGKEESDCFGQCFSLEGKGMGCNIGNIWPMFWLRRHGNWVEDRESYGK